MYEPVGVSFDEIALSEKRLQELVELSIVEIEPLISLVRIAVKPVLPLLFECLCDLGSEL
jgi:hypothetical protein